MADAANQEAGHEGGGGAAAPVPPLVPGGPRLRVMRCVRHSEREAVARCPACGQSFCRECVSEHEGKLLCAACLAKETRAADGVSNSRIRKDRTRLWRGLRCVCAVFALWGFFFLMGELLLRLPPEFHEGKIWRTFAGQ